MAVVTLPIELIGQALGLERVPMQGPSDIHGCEGLFETEPG